MRTRTRLLLSLIATLAAACGGSAVNGDAASDVAAHDSSDVVSNDATDTADVPPSDVNTDTPPSDSGSRVPLYHRTGDTECASAPPPGNCHFSGGGPPGACSMDSQCTAGTNGRCVLEGAGVAFCGCTYDSCQHDTDCSAGSTCACHGTTYTASLGNQCTPGNCRVDSDCGPAGYCSPTQSLMGCGGLGGYYCHTANDQCVNDSDCTGHGTGPQICVYQTSTSRWECADQRFCA